MSAMPPVPIAHKTHSPARPASGCPGRQGSRGFLCRRFFAHKTISPARQAVCRFSRARRACPGWDTGMIAAVYPNGIPSPSPGLAGGTTAYPGNDAANRAQPQRGCVRRSRNLANRDTTPLGLTFASRCSPGSQGRCSYLAPTLGFGTYPRWGWNDKPDGAIKSTNRPRRTGTPG